MHTPDYTDNPGRITEATRQRSSMLLLEQIRKKVPIFCVDGSRGSRGHSTCPGLHATARNSPDDISGLPGSNSPVSYTPIWVDITGICFFQMHCIITIMVAYSCFSI